jgi:hypothetical protein
MTRAAWAASAIPVCLVRLARDYIAAVNALNERAIVYLALYCSAGTSISRIRA